MTTQPEPVDVVVGGVVEQLRAVLELVETGELTAGPDQLAWLRGATDALRTVQMQGVSQPR
jgi:hypothetical protein